MLLRKRRVDPAVGGERGVGRHADGAASSSSSASIHDLPMITSYYRLSLDELFALPDHAHLAKYVPTFKGASIDVDLASDMTIDDIRSLLPDAPLGHCLLMRRILAERSTPKAFVPAGCDSSVVAVSRLIGRTAVAGDTREWIFENVELNLVVASLLFAVSFQAIVSAPESCAGGVECPVLLTIDACLWAVISAFFLSTVTVSWILNHFVGMISEKYLPTYVLDNFTWVMMGSSEVVLGVTLVPVAAATRMIIVLNGKSGYLSWTAWSLAGLFVAVFVTEWVYYFVGIKVTHKLNSFCVNATRYQVGIFCCSHKTKKKLLRGRLVGTKPSASSTTETRQSRYTTRGVDDGGHPQMSSGVGEEKQETGEGVQAAVGTAEMKLPYF